MFNHSGKKQSTISTQYKKIIQVLLCASMLLPLSCKKGWLDVNYNPNQLGDMNVTPDLILPALLGGLGGENTECPTLQRWMGYWCVPPVVPAGIEEQTYNITSSTQFVKFSIPLGQPTANIRALEEKARQTDQTFYMGIAKVITAIEWSNAVDMIDKLPYTEAFRGDIPKPKYDDGKLIYEDLMKQLDSAIQLIKGASIDRNPRIEITDIVFHGSKSKWVKFINTLKLRLLIHQANRPERSGYIQTEIAKIQLEGSGFLNSGENANVNPGFTELNPSLYYVKYQYLRPDWIGFDRATGHFSYEGAAANAYALGLYKETADPRIGYFYAPVRMPVPVGGPEPFPQPAPANFRGNRFGLMVNPAIYPYQSETFISLLGGITIHGPATPASSGLLKGYDMDGWILTSVESLFLQAESIQRGWITGNAEEAYKNAVQESFRWLNLGGNSNNPVLSDAVFNTWYNAQVAAGNAKVSWAAAPDKYKLLMLQKYLSLNGINAFETWTDYRRNNRFPDVPLSADPGRTATSMPIRLPYDAIEYQNNTENVNAVGPVNIFTSKIWWMP